MKIQTNLNNNKFVLWGVGNYGKAYLESDTNNTIIAIIDSDKELIGTYYNGIEIITLEHYIDHYNEYYIIISPNIHGQIVERLRSYNITKYFILPACPIESWFYSEFDFMPDLRDLSYDIMIGVYGNTLYSMALFWYLKSKNYDVRMIIDNSYESAFSYDKTVDFNITPWAMEITKLGKNDLLLYSNRGSKQEAILRRKMNCTVHNAYKLDTHDLGYGNEELAKFKNKHKGEKCFIVATGPSLNMDDLDTLNKNRVVTFSMNNIMPSFDKTQWRPDYYVIMDIKAISVWSDLVIETDIPNKFIDARKKSFWDKTFRNIENIYPIFSDSAFLQTDEHDMFEFSTDITKKIINGRTVTYTCIQMAVYMGFSEIYLLGVDFSYDKHKNVEDAHFSKDYYTDNYRSPKFHVSCLHQSPAGHKRNGR